MLLLALGVVLTLMTKPTHQSSASLLIEKRQDMLSVGNISSPLHSVLIPPSWHKAETQVEVLRSSSLLDRVYKEAGLQSGSVGLDVRQVTNSDRNVQRSRRHQGRRRYGEVVDVSAISTSPSVAPRFIEALFKVYISDARSRRARAISSALDFAQGRLEEENRKLSAAGQRMQRFKQRLGLVDPVAQRKGELAALSQAQDARASAEQRVASLRARLSMSQAMRRSLSARVERAATVSNTSELRALQQQLDELRSQRKSPPLLATADAQVLAPQVDGVLYVMQLGRVPRSSVLRSFELLHQARANVLGIVLNKIDEKTERSSYYSYSAGLREESPDESWDKPQHARSNPADFDSGAGAIVTRDASASTSRNLAPAAEPELTEAELMERELSSAA